MTLSNRLALISLVPACLPAQDIIQIHGYIQGRFTNQDGTPERLEIRRARLLFSGNPFSKLSYTFQVDFAKRPYLMDGALSWEFSRALRLTAGQFKIPFSTESLISDYVNTPIARARVVNALAPGRDTGVQGRDVGVQVAGSLFGSKRPILEYASGVFRGQTWVYASTRHYPAVAGRILIHPSAKLAAGADWYSTFSTPAKNQKRRFEAEASYERGRMRLRAEQIFGTDATLVRRGGYALASWRLTPHWEPLARADWLTANVDKPNSSSIAYLGGVNFYEGKHVKISANAGAQHDQGPRGLSSLFLAQTMLGF